MTVNDFIKNREDDWQRLAELIDRSSSRSGIKGAEVRELGALYRTVTSDLAIARRDYPAHRVNGYLNQLLTRAHSHIYREDSGDFRRIWHYIIDTIPQTFRETQLFTLVAFLLFMIPAIIGFHLASTNPDVATPLGLTAIRETLVEHEIWTDIPLEERPYASAFIMSNNIRVAILAFGGGVTFGLFTVYILVMNGLTIGAVLGLATHYGMGGALFDFIFAHGVVELSVIFIAGGAGLQLGWALLRPGLYSRRDALGIAAQRAIALAMMALPFLIVAGLIEGFISPSDAEFNFTLQLIVGLGSGALMYSYLYLSGRSNQKSV